MRNILRFFFTFVIIQLCTGCISEEEYDNSPSGNFEALWKIIDTRYCFHDYKQMNGCTAWNEVYGKYRSRIHDDMNDDQLFEVLCDMLAELRDGHVNLYTAGDVGRYWKWQEDYPENFNESILKNYLGTDYRIAAGIKYKILDDNIGYIRYESFSSGIGNGNLDEVMRHLQLCNGLIVDVRNNSGGTLTYAERLSERFTNDRLLVGYLTHKTGNGHQDFSAPEAEYIEPSKGIRWQKETVVLTNRSCYSATNTFIRNMKEMPRVTVMGDRTGGGSGLPVSSELPNGWAVRFSACPTFDARMKHIEFGIEPDIIVSLSDTDILRGVDTLIENARELLNR